MPSAVPAASSPIDSYLLCATPRSGSSLLCGLLDSSGVAGHPESYFRLPSEQEYADRWGIVSSPDGAFSYADYVRAAIAEGTTGNGVFAARIMWGTLDELIAKLGPLYPDEAGSDLDLLTRAFGRTRFVYLRRGDVLAQAVSRLRAEQTNVWHEETGQDQHEPEQEPRFDFGQLDELVRQIQDDNAAWQRWFASVGVRPCLVRYEGLAAAPVSVALGVLDFLGLEVPAGRQLQVRHKRLADDLSAQWIDRYRREQEAVIVGNDASLGRHS
jgi:trehalose 2-sulfotransferase